MSNLNKRILTSIPLLILLTCTIYNNIILVFSLYVISAILIYEFLNILKNIFKRNKKNLFIFLNLFILYICLFASQIYFFLSSEFDNKQNVFLFILSICIFTYAGMIGSFICSLIICMLFIIYFNFSINLIIFTFLISLVSQSGDLFVSYLKRKATIKDTGKFLPGHGGLLDRLDGIIFAVPVGIKIFIFF